MDARTKLDILYNDVLQDIRGVLDKMDALKVEIPASIQQTVDETVEKSNASFNTLNATLSEIEPAIQRAIAAETERAEIQVGTLVQAAEKLNIAATELGRKRLDSLSGSIDKTVKDAVDKAISDTLTRAISSSIMDVKHELAEIEKSAKRIAAEAEKAAQGSLYERLGTMFAAGLVGAVLTTTLLITGINNDWISVKPVWDSRQIASELYNFLTGKK